MVGLGSAATNDAGGPVVEIMEIIYISSDSDESDYLLNAPELPENDWSSFTEQVEEVAVNPVEQDEMIAEPIESVAANSPEPNGTPLCLITQIDFTVVPCPVFAPPEEFNDAPRLAHAWGLDSENDPRFDLSGEHNKILLTEDFARRFRPAHEGHWALIPTSNTLDKISGAALSHSSTMLPHYLNEFPHGSTSGWYEYIHLKGNLRAFYRFNIGAENGTPLYTSHEFPFEDLILKSTLHPYYATASAALKAKRAQEGESDIPNLTQHQRLALNKCMNIYDYWLKLGTVGAGVE